MEQHVRTAEMLAMFLDNRFGIGPFRIGLNVILDLIPGFGDAIATILSLYIVWIGIQMKLPLPKLLLMLLNIGIDFLLGLIPVLGDAGYLFWKANIRNAHILREYANLHIIEGEFVS